MTRTQRFFNSWYQPGCAMSTEDWIYVGAMIWLSLLSFGLGLLLGFLWIKLI